MRRRWIGLSIVAISLGHALFGLIVFNQDLVSIAQAGVRNSIGADARLGAVAWFMLAGFFMTAVGLAVDSLERSAPSANLRPTGATLLLTTIVGIVLMPASGFWLLLPAAIAMVLRRKSLPIG